MTDQTAEEPEEAAGTDGEEGEKSASGRRIPGKKLILFIVLPLLLIGGAGGGIYASVRRRTVSHLPLRNVSRETFTPLPPLRVHREVVVHELIHKLGQAPANRVG